MNKHDLSLVLRNYPMLYSDIMQERNQAIRTTQLKDKLINDVIQGAIHGLPENPPDFPALEGFFDTSAHLAATTVTNLKFTLSQLLEVNHVFCKEPIDPTYIQFLNYYLSFVLKQHMVYQRENVRFCFGKKPSCIIFNADPKTNENFQTEIRDAITSAMQHLPIPSTPALPAAPGYKPISPPCTP